MGSGRPKSRRDGDFEEAVRRASERHKERKRSLRRMEHPERMRRLIGIAHPKFRDELGCKVRKMEYLTSGVGEKSVGRPCP